MSFRVYIPARYGASRLPGKPLLEFAGKPLLRHVWERAMASGAEAVVIATDDERIATVAAAFGAEVCLTDPALPSGTDRIAAAAALRGEAAERIIVNVQGDEPHMPPAVIRQVAETVAAGACDMATVCEPLTAEQLHDPNVVKVVRDAAERALYFSRATIPWDRDAFAAGTAPRRPELYRRHVGIYGYRSAFLARFVAWTAVDLEGIEALEQLRALVNGAVIRAPDAVAPCGRGVDTPADLARLRGEDPA
ncbi:MAG: 3-deoxy-manno-octulosonate cytidylyltransferase [Gammaproteobacteria bacterium]|nr:3-deoxy-manno-octulosonate cytidylyltransferase [Gammaproteobacteria bacterium]MCP5202459.1 3-deoxy-manno-octulosonate cytidylyltransferase [Gammaproteobacteria bacterium]